VCDPALSRREWVRQRWNLRNAYASVDELIAKEHLDSVHILTPPPVHVEVARKCLERRWHCLIEKPVALDLETGESLRKAAEHYGRTVGVNHNKIWTPAFQQLRRLMVENRLGDIKHVSVEHAVHRPFREEDWTLGHWSFPIFETAPHTFSLISALLGSIRETRNRICEVKKTGESTMISSWQSTLECERGNASAFISINSSSPYCAVSVLGSAGAARADLMTDTLVCSAEFGRLHTYQNVFQTARDGLSLLGRSLTSATAHLSARLGGRAFGDPYLESMRVSIGEFYQALEEGRESKVNLRAGLETIQACEMVAQSFRPTMCKCGATMS
jgi:predicted dehydrogenase